MSATYDPNLSTALDYVRFLIADTDVSAVEIEDEEITAVLTEWSANKYFAAAEILEGLHAEWAAAGKGVLEKQVGRLKLKRGLDFSSNEALARRITKLRIRGAWLSGSRSRMFQSTCD